MEDQKRLIFTIVIATGFLFLWMTFFAPKPAPRPKAATTQTETTQTIPAPSPAALMIKGTSKSEKKTTAVTAVIRTEESPIWRMQFSNVSGTPTKIDLKRFRANLTKESPPVNVVPFMGETTPPLRWQFEVDGKALTDEDAMYTETLQEPRKIVYERDLSSDVRVRKTYSWKDDAYLLEGTVELINRSATLKKVRAETALVSGMSGFKNPSAFNPGDPLHLTAYINDASIRLTPADIAKGKSFPVGDIRWAGVDSRYFLVSMVPVEAKWGEVRANPVWKDEAAEHKPENLKEIGLTYAYVPRDLPANGTIQYVLRMYAGPKDIQILEAAAPTLDRAIDLGDWLGPIARPILWFLKKLYGMIPNYGVAIILLTVLVRLLMFPLAQQQAKSMRKMQVHKPEMDALKTKYADNKETYSRELMNYMKTHKINPMGGCLLLLPQLPIFFALYRVLYNAIELRQAPFAFWIRDLSFHDPYFVLPVVLGGVMLVQQRLTPTPGVDPTQAAVMKIMPVMFTFFMLFLPSGLNLYILVSTLWGIGQQLWVQRGLAPQPTAK